MSYPPEHLFPAKTTDALRALFEQVERDGWLLIDTRGKQVMMTTTHKLLALRFKELKRRLVVVHKQHTDYGHPYRVGIGIRFPARKALWPFITPLRLLDMDHNHHNWVYQFWYLDFVLTEQYRNNDPGQKILRQRYDAAWAHMQYLSTNPEYRAAIRF